MSAQFKPHQKTQFGLGSCHVHAATSLVESFCYRVLEEQGFKGYKHLDFSEAFLFIKHVNDKLQSLPGKDLGKLSAQELMYALEGGKPLDTLKRVLFEEKIAFEEQVPMTFKWARAIKANIGVGGMRSVPLNMEILNRIMVQEFAKKMQSDSLLRGRVARSFALFQRCTDNKFKVYQLRENKISFPRYAKKFLDQGIPVQCSAMVSYPGDDSRSGPHAFVVMGYDSQRGVVDYKVRDSNTVGVADTTNWDVSNCAYGALVLLSEREALQNYGFLRRYANEVLAPEKAGGE